MPINRTFKRHVRIASGMLAATIALTALPGAASAQKAPDLASIRDRLPEDEVIYLVMPDRFCQWRCGKRPRRLDWRSAGDRI